MAMKFISFERTQESRQARRVAAAGVAMAGLRHEGAGWRVRNAARLAARRPLAGSARHQGARNG
ncbi:hypothetical protein GLUCORHAEAF1_13675 [Komagataeibacter rhaeticus AF1]|nr:hypothetical protein GLUCORHAEAF1_13675 [Komagataeibacter rhaeticus AF1]